MSPSVNFNSPKSQLLPFFDCSGIIRTSIYDMLTKRQVLFLHHFLVNRHTAGKWQDAIAMDASFIYYSNLRLWPLQPLSLFLSLTL